MPPSRIMPHFAFGSFFLKPCAIRIAVHAILAILAIDIARIGAPEKKVSHLHVICLSECQGEARHVLAAAHQHTICGDPEDPRLCFPAPWMYIALGLFMPLPAKPTMGRATWPHPAIGMSVMALLLEEAWIELDQLAAALSRPEEPVLVRGGASSTMPVNLSCGSPGAEAVRVEAMLQVMRWPAEPCAQ